MKIRFHLFFSLLACLLPAVAEPASKSGGMRPKRPSPATARARAAIEAELAKQNLKAAGYRLLGYNSPFVPRGRQTHELQALLP